MMSEDKHLIPHDDWYAIIDFLDWYDGNGRPGFTKATINAYREEMMQSGKSRSSINQTLSAIRKLAAEAADNGLVPPHPGLRRGTGKGGEAGRCPRR